MDNKQKLKAAGVMLLLNQPFFGHFLLSRKVESADFIPTAATDGNKIYFNDDFLEKLSVKQATFVLMHELEHIVFEHLERRGTRDPQLFNVASDYVINSHIVNIGLGEMPELCLYDRQYDGMISEEVYEKLKDDPNASKLQNFDVHIPMDMSEEVRRAIRQDIRKARVAGKGQTPAELEKLFDEYDSVQIDWREALKRTIEGQIPFDYTMSKRSRRSLSMDVYLPSITTEPTVEVSIGVDTSGSISGEELKTFLSEIHGIIQQYVDFKIDVWCFDTAIHNHKTYSTFSEEELSSYQPAGRGGTTFEVNWEYMKEKGLTPKQFILLTDGYPCGGWGDPDYCETIFVIVNNNDVAPFGQTINITSGFNN